HPTPHTCHRLARWERYKSPIRIVIGESGIENSSYAETSRAGQHPEWCQTSLRTRQRKVIARGYFQIVCEQPSNQDGRDSIRVRVKIGGTRCNSVQCLACVEFELGVNSLQHHASCVVTRREKHGVVNRRFDRANAGGVSKARHQFTIVSDALGAGGVEGY